MKITPCVFLWLSAIICPIMAEVLTQSFVIRLMEMEQLILDQKQVINDQKEVIDGLKSGWEQLLNNATRMIENQKKVIDTLKSGVYFSVGLSRDTTLMELEILKFDKIITNVGGGYIDDSNNADYGKFIAPQNGTYQFSATFYNVRELMGGDLMMNSLLIIAANNGGNGPAILSAILDLEEGDQVYLERPGWVEDDTAYSRYFTSFSGVLVHAAV